jgi:hypothetical protein
MRRLSSLERWGSIFRRTSRRLKYRMGSRASSGRSDVGTKGLVIRKIGTGGNWRLRDTFATYQIVALVDIPTREVSIGLRLPYVQLFVRPCAILECYHLRCTLFGIEDKIAQWSRRRRRRRRRRPLARARFNIIR